MSDSSNASTARPPLSKDDAIRVAVLQDGARLHYAVPLALFRMGCLDRVFCDWYSRPYSPSRAVARLIRLVNPALGQHMLDRYCAELKGARIFTNPALTWKVTRGRRRFSNAFNYYCWESQRKRDWILRKGYGNANALFGFIRNIDPELCADARRRGLVTIADQIIAPMAIEMREEAMQTERFPEWMPGPGKSSSDAGWVERERATWQSLDHITCASEYVRDGLLSQGVESRRVTINPYPVDASHFPVMDRSAHKLPLVVGFVGALSLRKGVPYFLKTAAHFDPAKVRFVMIGSSGLSSAALEKHRGNVELVGAVPRSQIPEWLGRFDLYYFPSTCEGSAGSVMEAMMTGLPVIASPNSGSVVRNGVDGRIVAYDDIEGAVAAISHYAENADARITAGRSAAKVARSFTLDQFAHKLVGAIAKE